MGWLLTRKRVESKRRPRAARKPRQPMTPAQAWAIVKGFSVLVVVAGVVIGWRAAEHALVGYVQAAHPAPTQVERVYLADAPNWMGPSLQKHLKQIVADQLTPDPLDGTSVRRAADALSHSPWIQSVTRVERQATHVAVYAKYRQPYAAIQQGDERNYVIDHACVRLPGVYLTEQIAKLKLPLITGVAAPAPDEGAVWPGAELASVVELVTKLNEQPYAKQIRSYDASQHDGMGRLRLVIRTGTGLVRWGLPPGQERAIEPTTQVKLDLIAKVYRQTGSIDAGGKVVDIFSGTAFVHDLDESSGSAVVSANGASVPGVTGAAGTTGSYTLVR